MAAEDIPQILKDWCDANHTTPKRLSVDLGHGPNWLYDIFERDQPHLAPYAKIADSLSAFDKTMTIQLVASKIENKTSSDLVNALKKHLKIESDFALSKRLGISRTVIISLSHNEGKLNGLKAYVILSEKTGIAIDDLRKPQPELILSA